MTSSANDRDLIPSGQCDQVIGLKPETCRRCGQELSRVDSDPPRHQVWEFPAFPSSRPVNGYPPNVCRDLGRDLARCLAVFGRKSPGGAFAKDFPQCFHKFPSIPIIQTDRLLPVPSIHDVVERLLIFIA